MSKRREPFWQYEPSVQAVRKGQEAILQIIGKNSAKINVVHNGYTLLQAACCEGNREVVKFLLDRGASVHAKGRDYESFHLAAEEGHEDVLKLLIRHNSKRSRFRKFNLNKDLRSNGQTLLRSAMAAGGAVSVIEYLLDLGAVIQASDLLQAIRGQREDIVKLFLARDCQVVHWRDFFDNQLLHEAAEFGNVAVLKLLLDHGKLDVNARNRNQQTPLHIACEKGNEHSVRMLIERGARVDAVDWCGGTVLLYATKSGNSEVLKLTMNCGIDVNAEASRETPLHVACALGNEAMVKILLEAGARVNGWEDPLWVEAYHSGKMSIILLLMDYGCDVNGTKGNWWMTREPLLNRLYKDGKIEILRIAVERGADVNVTDRDGDSMLHKAVRDGRMGLFEFLLARGSDVKVKNSRGETVAHVAADLGVGSDGFLERLIDIGADINARDKDYWTPLMVASYSWCEAKVQLLLDHGADIETEDEFNQIVVEQALKLNSRRWEILVRQLVRIKYKRVSVSDEVFEVIEKNDGMRAYKIKCEKELESMRSDDSFPFWGLLVSTNRCLGRFAGNEGMIVFLKSNECEKKYPIYSFTLQTQMKRGILRKTLLDKVQYFFKAVGEAEGNEHLPKLPILCVREIFSYFTNSDFINLIKVCDPHGDFVI